MVGQRDPVIPVGDVTTVTRGDHEHGAEPFAETAFSRSRRTPGSSKGNATRLQARKMSLARRRVTSALRRRPTAVCACFASSFNDRYATAASKSWAATSSSQCKPSEFALRGARASLRLLCMILRHLPSSLLAGRRGSVAYASVSAALLSSPTHDGLSRVDIRESVARPARGPVRSGVGHLTAIDADLSYLVR